MTVPLLLLFGLIAGVAFVAAWLGPRLDRRGLGRSPSPECEAVVLEEGGRVVCARPGGRVEAFRWESLDRIQILTSSDGPFGPDFFWVFRDGDGGGATIPGGAEGLDAITARAFALPGFDHESFLEEAIPSTDDSLVTVWRRSGAEEAPDHF